jgi:hypothetical protein
LIYSAPFLQGTMSFANHTFSWTPPSGSAGNTYRVKFMVTTASGGTDAFVADFNVVHGSQPPKPGAAVVTPLWPRRAISPVTEDLTFDRPLPPGRGAVLSVFDGAGRRVVSQAFVGGEMPRWDLRDRRGRRVDVGLYFFRLNSGAEFTLLGRVVVLQ